MSNKSFTTKGLSRQIEEKANKLEDDLHDLREKYSDLQDRLEGKTREAQRLQDAMQELRQDAEVREQRLNDANELLRNDQDIAVRKEKASMAQVQSLTLELQRRSEEKDLLQSRHDALTTESQSLRRDLAKSQAQLQELQQALEDEKRHSLDNDRALRTEAKEKIQSLSEEVDELRRQLENEKSVLARNEKQWDRERKDIKLQTEKAEQKVTGLQRTIDKLQASEGTLSGRELKLQEALESEKQRYQGEEALLNRQIRELEEDIIGKRQSLEENRTEILRLKEELRIAKRDQAASEENRQALEDELYVLQSALDEETERARENLTVARQEADNTRSQLHDLKQELVRIKAAHDDALAEIENFQGDLQAGHGSNEQLTSRLQALEGQLQRMRSEKQGLQDQLSQREIDIASLRATIASTEADINDVATLRQELSAARARETEYIQRDASHKEAARDLKRQITDLERQLHDMEISKFDSSSPKSSVGGSARKTELIEVRRQLTDAHQQLKEHRAKSKEIEREHQRKLATVEQEAQQQIETVEQQRDQLEQQISQLEQQQEQDMTKLATADKTIARLRDRCQKLEKDLNLARANQNDDRTLAEERRDLHDMLKDAKLEAEDLQIQLTDRDSRIQAISEREQELRTQITRIRNERTMQSRKATALATELDSLQLRYEAKVDEMARQQQEWEEERKSIVSRVRFANQSVSDVHARDDSSELKEMEAQMQKKEKKHQAELRGMAKQIQWLRARCRREEGFRAGLAHEKKFLCMQIDMFEAW
jgi:chromosome segregation ATPase